MAYRVGSVVQQPIKSYGEVTAEAEDQQLQQQDRQLRALTLQEAVEQRRAKVAEAQAKAQKDAAREAFLKDAAAKYRHDNGRPDLDALANAAIDFDPEWGMEIRKQVDTSRKTAADTEKLKFEHDATVAQASSNLLRASLKNPALYGEVRQRIITLDPKADGHLPPEFDPAVVTQFADLADAYQTKSKGDVKAIDMLEQGRIDDWIGWRLEHAKSQEDVDEVFDDATARFDAPTVRTLQHTYPTQFGPEFAATVAATRASRQQAKPSSSAGSDYAQFLARWATEKHKTTPDKLTASQELAARKAYGQSDDAARRPLAPIVIQTAQGPMVTTGSDRTNVAPIIGPDGKPLTQAPTTAQRDRVDSAQRAVAFLDLAETLSKRINTDKGLAAKLTGTWRELKAKANEDDDVAEYVSLIELFTPLLARAAGHTGVLTEPDYLHTIQALPKAGDSATLAARKMKNLRTLVGGAAPNSAGDGPSDYVFQNGKLVKRGG